MNATRTRFAPSPTGFLHIGGVRTALFNWLYARRHGGQFILRIDDTDRQRNVEAALAPILAGFRWLGIDWDEGPEVGGDAGPYYQSERSALYQSAVDRLLANGKAYRDYASAEELQQERDEAQAKKERFVYSRRFMAETAEQQKQFEAEGRNASVRLKMPREGQCQFVDEIRGEMKLDWHREQDQVIQRADGSFIYHLASVVDDYEMRISHVIRAEEHLSNTARQIFIAEALGYPLPSYAHLPFVAEPGSKNKLSKRKLEKYLKNPDFSKLNQHGLAIAEKLGEVCDADSFNPVIVDFYERVGYLPQAIVNYLLLLGWSLDDKTEFFTREEMIESFSLERVNKAAASFDATKLFAFQEHYMGELSVEQKFERCLPYLQRAGYLERIGADGEARARAILGAAADRIRVAGDILDYDDFFTPDAELPYDEATVEKRLRKPEEAAELLTGFRERLKAADPFDAATLEAELKRFVEERETKIGRIIHALRLATTGRPVGFGMFETLEILGRTSCLARIDRALALL